MNPEWELRAFKWLFNIPFRFLDHILRFPSKPKFQQTRMVLNMYQILQKTYEAEVKQGIFAKDVRARRGPIHMDMGDADGNFERMLSVSAKMLAQISERDRYYRQWLGLLFILASYEMNHINLSPKQVKKEISEQWHEDLTFLDDMHLLNFKQVFDEILLSWYLGNIAKLAQIIP